MQKVIKRKRDAYKRWHKTKSEDDRRTYQQAKHAAKASVKKAKRVYMKELYDHLESREGEREIYRIARRRAESTKNMEHFLHQRQTW